MADFDLQDLSSVSDFYAEIKVAEPKKFRLSGPLVKSELIVKPPKRFTSYWTSSANWTGVLNKDGQPNPGPEVSDDGDGFGKKRLKADTEREGFARLYLTDQFSWNLALSRLCPFRSLSRGLSQDGSSRSTLNSRSFVTTLPSVEL